MRDTVVHRPVPTSTDSAPKVQEPRTFTSQCGAVCCVGAPARYAWKTSVSGAALLSTAYSARHAAMDSDPTIPSALIQPVSDSLCNLNVTGKDSSKAPHAVSLTRHMRKTPNVVGRGGALSAAARARPSTRRVSAGSMTPSSHSRADANSGAPSRSYLLQCKGTHGQTCSRITLEAPQQSPCPISCVPSQGHVDLIFTASGRNYGGTAPELRDSLLKPRTRVWEACAGCCCSRTCQRSAP